VKSNEQTAVLLFFIDGLGIGISSEHNPLARIENVEPLAHFKGEQSKIIFDGVLIPTDARLGIEGRPQSASGQTTILTGVNAPKFLGVHKQGFPNQALRDVIAEHSIFLQLKRKNIEPNVFANAYTPKFFTKSKATASGSGSNQKAKVTNRTKSIFRGSSMSRYVNEQKIKQRSLLEPQTRLLGANIIKPPPLAVVILLFTFNFYSVRLNASLIHFD
jgi:hypothetical protein